MRRLLLLSFSAGLAMLAAGCALGPPHMQRQPPAELRTQPWQGMVPACHDPAVIADIQGRFSIREWEFWGGRLEMGRADRIRQIAMRPWGSSYIPRRFCQMRAWFNDGHYRTVTYSIAEDLGPIGVGWGTEWCVVGLDRHYAFAPHCRAAGP